jgi:hypothetical protein
MLIRAAMTLLLAATRLAVTLQAGAGGLAVTAADQAMHSGSDGRGGICGRNGRIDTAAADSSLCSLQQQLHASEVAGFTDAFASACPI